MSGGVLGAVLAGGASTRMGADTDKALAEVDGVPMARRVADALLAGGAERVILIGGDPGRLSSLRLALVPDHHPGAGPLGGLLTALAVGADAGAGIVVVAPCDQPRLDGPTVAALANALSAAPASVAAAVGTAGGVRHVLPVAVRPQAATAPAAALAAAFAKGARSLRDGLGTLAVLEVECGDPAPFLDVDTPAELRRASRPRPPP